MSNGIETRRQKVIQAQASRRGYRGKVNAKCVECIYDPISGGGTWREQVAACASTKCPLWPIRAASRGKKAILTTEKQTISTQG